MKRSRHPENRGVTPVVSTILFVAVTIVLASVLGVFVLSFGEEVQDTAPYAALEVDFEQNASEDIVYSDFHWQIEVRHTGGEVIDARDITVHLDHGDQRVTGTINQSLKAGDTLTLNLVHNNQGGNTIPDGFECGDVNVACRLAGDDGNYPTENTVRLLMIDEQSNAIIEEREIVVSGEYGIYNGRTVGITDETFTFA